MKNRILLLLIFTVLPATLSRAQSVEISPFVGAKVGGTIPVNSDNELNVSKLRFDNSVSYGVTAGYNFGEHMGVEFLWSRQSTNVTGLLSGGEEAGR